MSTDPETRTRGVQLALPLPDPPADDPVDTAARPAADDAGWRLDEHTRRVGIRGIAEARARLRAGSGRAA